MKDITLGFQKNSTISLYFLTSKGYYNKSKHLSFLFLSKVFPANGLFDYDNTRIFHLFKIWIGMIEFDHCILEMHPHHRGHGSNSHSSLNFQRFLTAA